MEAHGQTAPCGCIVLKGNSLHHLYVLLFFETFYFTFIINVRFREVNCKHCICKNFAKTSVSLLKGLFVRHENHILCSKHYNLPISDGTSLVQEVSQWHGTAPLRSYLIVSKDLWPLPYFPLYRLR